MSEESLLNLALERIVARFDPIRVILFGSRVRGNADPQSDIDLLVVLPSVADKRRQAIEIRRVLRDLPVGKDIIVSTPEEIARRGHVIGTFLRSVLREGRVIFERA